MAGTSRAASIVLGVALAACAGGGSSVHEAGVPLDFGPGHDAGTHPGTDAGAGDDAALASAPPRGEICGNAFDDDMDGVDDAMDTDCNCAVGTTRACWLGPPDVRGIGACHDGLQTCNASGASATWSFCDAATMPRRELLANGADDDCDGTIDEPDGICLPTVQHESGAGCSNARDDDCDTRTDCADPDCASSPSCPPSCPAAEDLCWGSVDEDCDGHVDCDDSDCTGDPACLTGGPCPAGQTPTYHQRDLGTSWGSSSIAMGDGGAVMTVSCATGSCGAGQVQVILEGGASECVPPPPACAGDTAPNYVASGMWQCSPPCTYIIHFGSIYGGLYACAGPPPACGAGNVPTFDVTLLDWVCRTACDGGLYDPIHMASGIVCVPC